MKDIYTLEEIEREEAEEVAAIVARGIRTGREFKIVRKHIDLRGFELAEILGVTAETVSRWENEKADLPRLAAFTLGELYLRPKITRQALEKLAG